MHVDIVNNPGPFNTNVNLPKKGTSEYKEIRKVSNFKFFYPNRCIDNTNCNRSIFIDRLNVSTVCQHSGLTTILRPCISTYIFLKKVVIT